MKRKEKAKKPRSMVSKVIVTVLNALACIVLAVLMVAVNIYLPAYARVVDVILDSSWEVDNSNAEMDGLDLEYNKADYTGDELSAAEDALNESIANEGIVLLKNEGSTLPLSEDTTYSLFSVNSATVTSNDNVQGGRDLKTIFEEAGVSLNTTLYDFYTEMSDKGYGLGSGSISYGDEEDFSINEVPLSELEAADGVLDSVEGTVPVYWLKRVAGEGRDMPRSMYNHTDIAEDQSKSYLEPDSVELELLQYLNDNYDTVLLVVNSNAALELDWLEDYPNIKAVLYAPSGLPSLPNILTGAVNPSGRTVDTFAANALSSPAAQNFGDYQYVDSNGELTVYNYVTYAEGIYVGYRYYETRYEDLVMGTGNAGEYDYASEVVYPFGYGLSYTTFDWSDFSAVWDGDVCTLSVTVTNTGDTAGKDVVEIYLQSPYTEYDVENSVEKSSVELVAYGKTDTLQPGEAETLALTVNREQLKSYDSEGAGTYILDAGDYYLTAASDAHAAVNNILSAKGYTGSDGMTGDGDASFVSLYTVDSFDSETYSTDSYSGAEITNQLSDARGDVTYLTRSDWVGTFPTHDGEVSDTVSTWGNEINGEDGVSYVYVKTASDELLAQLESFDSGNPTDSDTLTDEIVYGADNGLTLIELRGLEYDDPLWEELLDQLTAEDYYNIIGVSGYGVEYIDSVQKPLTLDADTAAGLMYGSTGTMFSNSITLAQTWNQELAYEFGSIIGDGAIAGGASGWYAPSMNIHRTPFTGRNGEYYSEDSYLSGVTASNVVYGAAEKGLCTFIKHFAFNDQENHRGDRTGQYGLATWLNEQSARELYLLPFEMCMKIGDVELNYVAQDENGDYYNTSTTIRAAQAVMTAFNRVGATWTGGSYNLITGILRTEWDFDGFVLTDNANTGVFMDGQQMIEAGGDAKLTNFESSARFDFEEDSVSDYHYARIAMHHILYTVVNSNVMNGVMPGSVINNGTRIASRLQIGINVVCGLLILLMVFLTIRRFRKPKAALR